MRRHRTRLRWLPALLVCWLAACSPTPPPEPAAPAAALPTGCPSEPAATLPQAAGCAPSAPTATRAPTATASATPLPTATPSATSTATASATPLPTATPAPLGPGGLPYPLATSTLEFGVAAHLFYVRRALPLRRADAAGFGWIRQQIHWKDLEGPRGRYAWGELDAVVNAKPRTHEQSSFGILNADGSPRPVFLAIQKYLAVLRQ